MTIGTTTSPRYTMETIMHTTHHIHTYSTVHTKEYSGCYSNKNKNKENSVIANFRRERRERKSMYVCMQSPYIILSTPATSTSS